MLGTKAQQRQSTTGTVAEWVCLGQEQQDIPSGHCLHPDRVQAHTFTVVTFTRVTTLKDKR